MSNAESAKTKEPEPLYQLKMSRIDRMAGCVTLLVIGSACAFFSCCISFLIVSLLVDYENQPLWLLIIYLLIPFVPIYWLLYAWNSRKTKKESRKTAFLYATHLELTDGINPKVKQFDYTDATCITVAKYEDSRLGFDFEFEHKDDYELDVDLAQFPRDQEAIEKTVLPFVLENWDEIIQREGASFPIYPQDTPRGIRMSAAFRVCVAIGCAFYPQNWGFVVPLFQQAVALWKQAKFCGETFHIDNDGIYSDDEPDEVTPLTEIRITKFDEVALVIESKKTGQAFMSPISGSHVYTAGHWLKTRQASGFLDEISGNGPNAAGSVS